MNASLVNYTILWAVALALVILDVYYSLNKKILKRLILGVAIYLFVFATIKSGIQWHVWSLDPIGKHLLPPENPYYFYVYAYRSFFLPILGTLAASLVVGFVLHALTVFSRGRLLSREEVLLGALLSMLVGWPNTVLLIGISFILMLVVTFFFKRTSVSPFMLASTVIIFLFGQQLSLLLGLKALRL